ncbi:MAG: acetyl-CoA carboxylase biotin carboxyl carrier protein, partial [bacterium]
EIKISSKLEIDTDLLKLINAQSNLSNLANLANLSNLTNVANFNQSFEVQPNISIETQVNTEDLTKYSKLIKAPLSGNFYINVAGTELISLNKNVKKGDVICVIEAMKVMNEVNSEFDGIVRKIIPNNGDFVKEGDILIVLE